MKRFATAAIALSALAILAFTDSADAGRLGGGKSFGAQRQSIAPPARAPAAAANPVMPAQPGAGMPAKAAAPAAAAPSGASRWLGPVAGIAAGLGLAALLAHFGLPEGFASVLLIGLVVIGIVIVARWLLTRRAATGPMQYAGASGGYAPRIEPVLPGAPQKAAQAFDAKPWPSGFDAVAFVRQAKLQFNRLQAAYDAGDRAALADVLTPEMMAEIGRDLDARGVHHATEIVTLEAEVLEVATEGGRHWASVRFTGLVREDGAPQPKPLDEIWNLAKPTDGSSGWQLAGIRQTA